MAYSSSKIIAVRDSFDDEDVSDEIEDEVFIRDGRNSSKMDEERGVKRPLMAPRRKHKSNQLHAEVIKSTPCRGLCIPCCYGIIAISIAIGFITLVVILFLWLPSTVNRLSFWKIGRQGATLQNELIPCTDIFTKDIWTKSLPKLTIESSIFLNDINHDGNEDIIIGYGTGADDQNVPPVVCRVYLDRAAPCLGGVLALDGKTGDVVWQHWMPHTVYWLDCSADLTGDSVKDCLASGKGGAMRVINGHDGSLLWKYRPPDQRERTFDVYAARFLQDVDGDGVLDVLAAHTGDNSNGDGFAGHLVLVSGASGRLLRQLETPGGEESYYAPQTVVQPDSQAVVLFGTGGQAAPGGLYAITLDALVAGDLSRLKTIYHDNAKGVMSAPVLVDINTDGYEDIVVSSFSSQVLAFDGLTFQRLWNYSTPSAETFSSPIPAYFNEDDIPDFLVKYQTGPGFPVYYYSQATLLDGKSGTTIQKPLTDSLASQSAGVSISMDGPGNDLLLYWSAYCSGHEDDTSPFSYDTAKSSQAQNKVDWCKIRFNSTQTYKLWALNQHIPPPGVAVYSSDSREALEYNNSMNTYLEAQQYMKTHPDFRESYLRLVTNPAVEPPPTTRKDDVPPEPNAAIFRHKENQPLLVGNGHHHANNAHGPGDYRGEEEEVISGYLNDHAKYPNVRKHGDRLTNHPHNAQQWQRQWQENNEPATYQELNEGNIPDRTFEGQLSGRDMDYESQYDPRMVSGYGRQRDERSRIRENLYNSFPDTRDNGKLEDRVSTSGGDQTGVTSNTDPGQLEGKDDSEAEISDGAREKLNYLPKIRDSYMLQGDERSKTMRGVRKHLEKREATNIRMQVSGIQRLSSTGSLVPSLDGSKDSMDVVFATYWLPAVTEPQAAASFRDCVQKKLAEARLDSSKFLGMDAAAIESSVTSDCGVAPGSSTGEQAKQAAFDSINMPLGQMTVYRIRVTCRCANLAFNERCSGVLPFDKQSWPGYLGWNGKGYFRPRCK